MKSASSSNTYKSFLLLFMIFALLLSFMFIPLYINSYDTTRGATIERVQGTLKNGIVLLDAMGTALTNAYTTTVSDADFRAVLYAKDKNSMSPVTLNNLCSALNSPFISFNIVCDVGIVYSQQDVITRFRSFSTDAFYFYPTFLACEEMAFDAWYGMVAGNASVNTWFPARRYRSTDFGSYTALTYARRWQRVESASGTPVVFFATLDCRLLEQLLVDARLLENGYIRISDSRGNVLFANGGSSYGASGCLNIEDSSISAGLTIDVGISNRYIHEEIRSLFVLCAMQLALLVVGSGAMVLLFSRHSSKPMDDIMTSINALGLNAAVEEAPQPARRRITSLSNDSTVVSSSIHTLDRQLRASTEIINEQSTQLRAHLFSRALVGGLYLEDETANFERLFPGLPDPYRLVRIKTNKADFPEDIDPFAAVVQIAAQLGIVPYYIHYIGYKTMIWLVAEEGFDVGMLHQINVGALPASKTTYNFLVSQPCSYVNNLSTAYQQLQCYGDVFGAEVIVMDDSTLPINHYLIPLSYSMLYDIYNALNAGKDDKACAILNGVADNILANPDNGTLLLHVYTMLYDMLSQLKIEYTEKLSKAKIPAFNARHPETLFRVSIPDCFRKIGVLMRERMSLEDDTDRVMRFINENLFSPELCLTMISEKLHIQKAAIQRVMKTVTGMTCFSYIELKRMERARALLKEGIAVQDVSTACGFSSPNSFYKAFKRVYNTAPSSLVDAGGRD